MKTMLFSFLSVALICCPIAHSKEKDEPYATCMAEQKDQEACLESVGRDKWIPYKLPDDCVLVKQTLEMARKMNWKYSFKLLYFNERCHRLGQPYFE